MTHDSAGAVADTVRGPYFDELSVGQVFRGVPSVTLTGGQSAVHASIVGNRLRLALDDELAEAVTGARGFAAPQLVWDTSIGRSTAATHHVKANLFYRSLAFRRAPRIGDTLTTVTTVDALKENTRRPGRTPTGLAVLHVVTTDQLGRPVLDYRRCAMLPLSGPQAPAGPQDDLDTVGIDRPADPDFYAGWDLAAFRAAVPGEHFADVPLGLRRSVRIADVVTGGPELARLTGNIAAVHHDAAAAGGSRLVYGGHTIGLAFSQVCQAFPNLVTVLGWERCDHTGPVREGDVLTTDVEVVGRRSLADGGLLDLRAVVTARDPEGSTTQVLDWTLTVLLA